MSIFERIPLYFDENEYNVKISDYEGRCSYFQTVLDKLKSIAPNIVFESEDLTPLFNNPKPFLVDKLVSEAMTIGGVELDKNKVFDLLTNANELQSIISEINYLNGNSAPLQNQKNLYSVAKDYFIDETGKIELKQSFKDNSKNQYTTFAKDEKQKAVFDSLANLVEAFKSVINILPNTHLEKIFEEYLEINDNQKTVNINYKAINRV